jgi:hypothetical protein
MVALREPLRTGARIPLADAGALRGAARRTAALRLGLAALLLAVLLLCLALARGIEARPSSYFAEGGAGVVVIDFSTSIDPGKYRRIARVLRTVAQTSQPMGMVIYSDAAYEAVPPGTRGDVLAPVLRFFERPLGQAASRARRVAGPGAFGYPANPWQETFRGGTRISAGLRVAREMLARDGVERGAVLLVSDLDDSPFDTDALTQEAIRYRREGLDLRLVSLGPAREDREMFLRLMGPRAFVGHRELLANSRLEERRTLVGRFPLALALAGGGLLLLLAVNERVNARLRWRAGRVP